MDEIAAELTTSPRQLLVEVNLPAPPNEVFRVISDFGNLPRWMPLMVRVEVDNTNAAIPGQVGAVRVIHAAIGRPTRETVRAYEAPWLLAYSADDRSLRGMYTDHTGILICKEIDDGATRLCWATYAVDGRNPLLRVCGRLVFRYLVNQSLRNLARQFP